MRKQALVCVLILICLMVASCARHEQKDNMAATGNDSCGPANDGPKTDVSLDPRFKQFLDGWSAWEIYLGKRVEIPYVWVLHDFEYNVNDPVTGERQVWLALGWSGKSPDKGYDAEALVNLGIFGNDPDVQVEIVRLGAAEIHVCYKGKEEVVFPAYTQHQNGRNVEKGYFVGKFADGRLEANQPVR